MEASTSFGSGKAPTLIDTGLASTLLNNSNVTSTSFPVSIYNPNVLSKGPSNNNEEDIHELANQGNIEGVRALIDKQPDIVNKKSVEVWNDLSLLS